MLLLIATSNIAANICTGISSNFPLSSVKLLNHINNNNCVKTLKKKTIKRIKLRA